MNESNASVTGNSPHVRLWLEYAGGTVPLAQIAPNWIIPVTPVHLPPGRATVVSEIDGRPYRRSVTLPPVQDMESPFIAIRDESKTPTSEVPVG